MIQQTLTEQTKNEISRLAHTTAMKPEEIALRLGVSVRTVYNYRDYGQGFQQPKKSTREARHWICVTCGYITYQKKTMCPYCQRGPFDSAFAEVGTPRYNEVVQSLKEKTQAESSKTWICQNQECLYNSIQEFEVCPNCGGSKIMLASGEIKEIFYCEECGHMELKPFNPCPECGSGLDWD